MNWLLEPLTYQFMQRGLFASVIVGVLCAVMGTYVVLRGTAFLGEAMGLAILPRGAMAEVNRQNLRRAIGYAITRMRETQLAEMKQMLERYREMSSATQRTTVTAGIAGSGAIALRDASIFERLVLDYSALFDAYLRHAAHRDVSPRFAMERIITAIGDSAGAPRDLIDIHVAALDRAVATGGDTPHARSLVLEGRLLALEMMGLLVDYYRVGYRRRIVEGAAS